MAAIQPLRSQIQQEDVAYRRSVSEAILTKIGSQSNFINVFQNDSHRFNLNGSFTVATGIDFYDGPQTMFYNSEIVGISFWQESGDAGTTEFDLRWIDTDGIDQGSIFSVTPKVTSLTKVNAFRNLVTGNDVEPAGVVLPTLAKTTFLEGETIYLRLISAMAGAFNGGLCFFYRPIN